MIVWLWLACASTDPDGGKSTVASDPDPVPVVEESGLGETTIEREVVVDRRQLKRMTVAQARDSMERISGGIVWGDEDESKWDAYADTLGVADYQLRVESDRSPSVMFQKFIDDAATATCRGWLEATDSSFYTIDVPDSTERVDVRSNVVGLRWQIQGKPKDASAGIIDDYEALFFKVHQRTDSVEAGWQTVCVAMFTHPDFFMY